VGLWAIRQRKRTLHMQLMFAAFASSTLFLVNYIYYHFSHGDTHFAGQGVVRPIYFAVLISHVLLSMVTFPMILNLGLSNRLVTHRRLSRWTWAAWMYVSVTGVVVYFMLHVIRL
jgi:putative membrane protein